MYREVNVNGLIVAISRCQFILLKYNNYVVQERITKITKNRSKK